MAITPYSLPSPQAISPYPIEGELVNKLEPQYALGMLNLYRSDRNIAQQGYEQEVQSQHQYAYDQLARQMAAEKQKGFTDIAKLPGGVDFARSSGIGLDLGANPESLARFAGATNLAQASENFQKAGAGWGSLAHAGAQVPFGLVPGLERYAGTPIGETDLVKAARIRAAGGGGGDGGDDLNNPKINIGQPMPGDANGIAGQTYSGRTRLSNSDALSNRLRQEAEAKLAAREGRTAPTTSASPSKSTTSAGPQQLDTSSPRGKQAQDAAMVQLNAIKKNADKGDPAAIAKYNDIKSTMKGGVFTIYISPDNKPYIQGKIAPYGIGQ